MKRWTALSAGLLFALPALWAPAGAAFAQEPPAPGEQEEDELKPEQAMQLLKDAESLMARAEELLHASSLGRALETEKEILKRFPDLEQKQTIEKIGKLVEKAEKREKDVVEKLGEIIKKART